MLETELVHKIRYPHSFAKAASLGQWQTAPHLELISRTVHRLINENRSNNASTNTLIIEAPPRHGKSEFISKYLPAWFLGRWPNERVILASYEANFARSWGRKARTILEEYGEELFGVSISGDQNAAVDWETDSKGGMVTAGVGGPMTGRGANLLIIDDPIKNAEEAMSETIRNNQWEWWQSTASTRIEPGGIAIVMATRWHKDDLSGRLIARAASGDGPPVMRIRLPAIAEDGDILRRLRGEPLWPDRWPLEKLINQQRNLEMYWWLALYQQRPSQHTSAEWPGEYFDGAGKWFHRWPDNLGIRVVALDPSKGRTERSDFSAFVIAGEDPNGVLWVEGDLQRRPPGRIVVDGAEHCRRFRPHGLGVEGNAWQELLEPMFEAEFSLDPILQEIEILTINNQINKQIRIRRLDKWLQSGRIKFRDTPGTRILVDQLREFPLAEHDDGPDALEMATRLVAHFRDGNEIAPMRVSA